MNEWGCQVCHAVDSCQLHFLFHFWCIFCLIFNVCIIFIPLFFNFSFFLLPLPTCTYIFKLFQIRGRFFACQRKNLLAHLSKLEVAGPLGNHLSKSRALFRGGGGFLPTCQVRIACRLALRAL